MLCDKDALILIKFKLSPHFTLQIVENLKYQKSVLRPVLTIFSLPVRSKRCTSAALGTASKCSGKIT